LKKPKGVITNLRNLPFEKAEFKCNEVSADVSWVYFANVWYFAADSKPVDSTLSTIFVLTDEKELNRNRGEYVNLNA